MLHEVLRFISSVGPVGAVIVTLLIVLITQYRFFKQSLNSKSNKFTQDGKNEKINASKKTSMDHGDASSSKTYLKELAKKVHDYNFQEVGAGEAANLEENQLKNYQLLKEFDFDHVNDGDSMVVNLPVDDDQDDVDMADLTPDDITVGNDVDDENGSAISPQALADIEAELLDSSILNESVDESDDSSSEETAEHQDLSCVASKLQKTSKLLNAKNSLSEVELAEERRIQRNQLSDILALMEQNPQMFGSVTKDALNEQASLYCI